MTFKPAKAIMASIAAVAALAAGVGSAVAAETSVSAADLAKSQPITVKADADISGKDFYAVQLAAYSAAQTDGTNITGYDLKDAGRGKVIDEALTEAGIDRTASGNASTVYETANPMAWVAANLLDSTSSPWAGKLRDFLNCLTPNLDYHGRGVKLVKGADANTMTANVKPGIYAIVEGGGRLDVMNAAITMMNGTGINGMTTLKVGDGAKTYKLGEVEYKLSDVTAPVKKIVEDGQSKDTNETAIGKTVNYKVTAKVPNWTGYTHYALSLYDTMGQGLTFNNDVKATVAGKTVTVKTVSDNGGIRILFAPTSDNSSDIVADKANYPVDADIVVTYSATVNRNAVIGGNGNPNGIELQCATETSYNPMSLSDSDKPECGATGNTVKTYVGAFDIVKQDAKGASLEGAEFNVYEAGKTTPVKFVKTGNTYRVADKTETTGTTTTVTAGNATITGVDDAYDVVETKSPFGNAIKARFTTTVTVNQKTGEYKAALTKADANHLVASDNKFTLTVTNCRNIGDMPKTGATWLAIYTTAGLLLVAAGAAMYLRRARA